MLISSIIRGIILVEVLSFLALTTRLYEPNLLALKYVAYRLYTDFTNFLTFFSVKPVSIASAPSPSAPIISGSNTIFSNPTSTTTAATTTAATTTAATTTAATTTAATTTAATTTQIPVVITCTATCGTCSDVTSAGGTIQSSNYPNEYENDLDCIYTITVTPDTKKIQLTFTTFIVETYYDKVNVYDGTIADTNLSGGLTGYVLPASFTTTTNKMTVRFKSDFINTDIPVSLQPGRWQAVFQVV